MTLYLARMGSDCHTDMKRVDNGQVKLLMVYPKMQSDTGFGQNSCCGGAAASAAPRFINKTEPDTYTHVPIQLDRIWLFADEARAPLVLSISGHAIIDVVSKYFLWWRNMNFLYINILLLILFHFKKIK